MKAESNPRHTFEPISCMGSSYTDEERKEAVMHYLVKGSLSEVSRALELQPDNRLALHSLASLALNQKKLDAATEWNQRIVAGECGEFRQSDLQLFKF